MAESDGGRARERGTCAQPRSELVSWPGNKKRRAFALHPPCPSNLVRAGPRRVFVGEKIQRAECVLGRRINVGRWGEATPVLKALSSSAGAFYVRNAVGTSQVGFIWHTPCASDRTGVDTARGGVSRARRPKTRSARRMRRDSWVRKGPATMGYLHERSSGQVVSFSSPSTAWSKKRTQLGDTIQQDVKGPERQEEHARARNRQGPS